ncbi:MAG: SpoIID/LytB domain-containing protein, partial [Chloroflexia bacterium]
AFSVTDIASLVTATSSPSAQVNLTVTAYGYGTWSLQSARYYTGDTLRIYPALIAGNMAPQVNIATSPRRTDAVGFQPDYAGAISVGAMAASTQDAASTSQMSNVLTTNATTMSSVVGPDAASWTPPSTIRVYRTSIGGVEVVPFKDYVKHVLPNEWIPTWSTASLRAGAIAVKEYGWYWVFNGGKQVSLGADVKDNTEDQVYDPNVSYASTDAAVETTWAYALLRNNSLFQAQYCAGSYGADPTGDCPWNGPYMTQWGSAYYADQGQSWDWILQFYYPNATISPNVGNGSSAPPYTPPAPPAPTKAVNYSVGQGADQPDIFVDAYNRNGGVARLGNPTGAVRWWLSYVSEHNVLAQPFAGADRNGGRWLVFDTLKSEVSDVRRAYLLEGGIAQTYAQHTPPGPEWIGAPTSDPYTASAQAGSKTSQGFASGLLAWDGQNSNFTQWPTQFNGWEARYFVGKSPAPVTGPSSDLSGQPALVQDQTSPNMDWAQNSGIAQSLGLGDGAWSAQFNKQIQIEAGTYDITLNADSGVRLWVDNLMAINSWEASTKHTEQYNIDLDGAPHTLHIQYFSTGGAAKLAFSITKRDTVVPHAAPPAVTPPAGSGITVPSTNPTGKAGLRVKVTWLGRSNPPSDSWAQPLTLMLSTPASATIVGSYMSTTDANGVAIYNGLPQGVYNIHVKGLHSLQSARTSINLAANQIIDVDMKAQIEGDLNGDNCVTVDDFSTVQAMVGTNTKTPGWNPAADLNNDGQVTAADVSLLRSGFDKCGDISADNQVRTMSAEGAPTFEQQMAPWLDPASLSHNLALSLVNATTTVAVGGIIEVQVYADTNAQDIDGGSFLLNYDPTRLAPVDQKGNTTTSSEPGVALPSVLGNWIDTQGGAVGFAASMLQGAAPQGHIKLAIVRFRTLQAGTTELHFGSLSLGQMQLTNGGTNLLAKTSSLTVTVNP